MRKLVSLFLALVMVLSLCSFAVADEPTTILFWHTRGSGANYNTLKASVDAFNETIGAEMGVAIEEVYQGSYAQLAAKLQLASQTDELPVIAVCAGDWISTLMDDNLLADLVPYATATGFDFSNLFDSLFQIPGNEDGQIHSIAYIKSTPLFYYNKTMADAKGLTISANPTIDEFEAFCKGLNEIDPVTGDHTVWGFSMYNNISYCQGNFLWQMDQAFLDLDENGKVVTPMMDGALLKVFSDWCRWMDEGWCRPFDSTDPNTVNAQMLYQGKLGGYLVSCGSMANISKNMKEAGYELGVTAIPTYNAENPMAVIGGGELVLVNGNHTEEEMAAGWAYLEFLMSDEQVALNAINTGYLPITHSVANSEIMQNFWAENPLYKVAYDQLDCAIGESYPYFENREEYRNNVQAVVSTMVQERALTPEEAVAQIWADNAHLFD